MHNRRNTDKRHFYSFTRLSIQQNQTELWIWDVVSHSAGEVQSNI